jgi:urate oxidase
MKLSNLVIWQVMITEMREQVLTEVPDLSHDSFQMQDHLFEYKLSHIK